MAVKLNPGVALCRSSVSDLDTTEDGGEAQTCCTGGVHLLPRPQGEAGCAVTVMQWQAAQDPEATHPKGWGRGTHTADAASHAVQPPSQPGKGCLQPPVVLQHHGQSWGQDPPGTFISGGFWPPARTSSSPLLRSCQPLPPSSPSLPPCLAPVPPTVTPQPPPSRVAAPPALVLRLSTAEKVLFPPSFTVAPAQPPSPPRPPRR